MPLIDLIVPQLAKRVAEFQQQMRPQGAGYLSAGQVTAPADVPTASDKALEALRNAPPQSPIAVVKNSALRQLGEDRMRAKHLALIPNAQVPDPLAPPVEGKTIKKNGKTIIELKPGEAVAMTEQGMPLDAKGKPLGYLKRATLVTPGGDMPMRTGVERAGDVLANPGGAYKFQQQGDTATPQMMEQLYGPHLNAVENNRDASGNPTDQFPPGYFHGMAPGDVENIKQGATLLRMMRKEREQGLPLM